MKMNPVVHFQLPFEEKNRMTKFYTSAFGWQTKDMGTDMAEYVVAQTTDTDDKGMIKTPGNINGGFYKRGEDRPAQIPNLVISVEDMTAAIKRVESAGGKLNSRPTDISGVGLFATFIDTEGNHMVMIEPKEM